MSGAVDAGRQLDEPYVEFDEIRSSPIPHRYVSGGFLNSPIRFSVYLPDQSNYAGRMLQYLDGGVGGTVNIIQSGNSVGGTTLTPPTLEFVASCGAFLVESNQGVGPGGPAASDEATRTFGASASTGRFARALAEEHYGVPTRHGYLFGGSGGGRRTLLSLEHVADVWSGAVAYLTGADGSHSASIAANAISLFGERCFNDFPFEDEDKRNELDGEKQGALTALHQLGIPPGGELAAAVSGIDVGFSLFLTSPEYVATFWNDEGFEGCDGKVEHRRIDLDVQILEIVRAGDLLKLVGDAPIWTAVAARLQSGIIAADEPVAIITDASDPSTLYGATLTSSDSSFSISCSAVVGNVVVGELRSAAFPRAKSFSAVQVGESLHADNRAFLAFCHSARHDVNLGARMSSPYVQAGKARLPQTKITALRPLLKPTGNFHGKLIQINATHDVLSPPVSALDFAELVEEAGTSERYRLWFVEHATHRPRRLLGRASRGYVDYDSCILQAVRDLIAWVERDEAPRPSVAVESNLGDGSDVLVLGAPALQASIRLSSSSDAEEIIAGQIVDFSVELSLPDVDTEIVGIEWDFGGGERVDDADSANLAECIFSQPGTFQVVVRVGITSRDGIAADAVWNATSMQIEVATKD